MNAAKRHDDCARFACAIDTWVDGELDPSHAAETEGHVLSCSVCAERVALRRSLRASLKRRAPEPVPTELRARMAALLEQERTRAAAAEQPKLAAGSSATMLSWKVSLPLAAAAGVAIAVAATSAVRSREQVQRTAAQPSASTASAASFDAILDELVSLHAQPLPPETTSVDELPRLEPFVGVPLRRTAVQMPLGTTFRGARVHAVHDRRAALLQLVGPGERRITMYVFDPAKIPVEPTAVLTRRIVRERPVFVGKMRGYSLAAAERHGVAYAFASDLPDDQSTQLVASIRD